MESSAPSLSSSSNNNNDSNIAQDPLALPNTDETTGLYSSNDISQDQHELCGNLSSSQSNTNCSDKENNLNGGSEQEQQNLLNDERRMQYESNNYSNNDPRKLNHHMAMQQHHLHEPHKTFSHSIENLSKTTEKCTPNDMKIYPNLIDGHEYDDGYETGVGDLMSHKYKLPSLPPPSSSPYSSLSSSSMSTISTATTTPTNLGNPQQQQQSPSYMGNGNTGNASMNHYQQQQQQQQYLQNQQQQYQTMQNQNHMNSFNYHHMFGRMQQPQQISNLIKNEIPDNDPYRFVDDDLSNGIASTHPNGMHNAMHPHHSQHMSSPGLSGNYSASSSPMPLTSGNAPMMQFSEHHMSPHNLQQQPVPQQQQSQQQNMHHMNHQMSMQQLPSQQHLMNGNAQNIHAGINPTMMMMNNDAPKKRGRKKKLRDENGNPIEDRPVKERKKHDRFNGMPEDEVMKRSIPDHITSNLDIVIVGINPGLFAAYKGHHYAGPGNHFWKCLYLSGLTGVQMTAEEDYKLLQYGIGFTNMVQRPTKGSADLTRKEIKEGSRILLEKIRKFQPKIAVFNGKLIFEVFSGKKDFCFGKQPETVEGTNTYMWVMPSSSARCAQLPRAADKVPFYAALKKFRDYLNGLVPDYDEGEYVFNDPKYNQISTEAELKDDQIAFTTLESGEIVMADPNKKKRGRPKKIRGENGEEIVTPSRRKNNNSNNANSNENSNHEGADDDPNKKKRGRPKKNKDGTISSAPSKKRSNASNQTKDKNSPQQQNSMSPSITSEMSHHQSSPLSQNQQLSSLSNNGNNNNSSSSVTSFLPPIESPSANNNNNFQNGAINQQNSLQQQPSPVNLCFPPASLEQHVPQPEISPHQQQTTYSAQQRVSQQQIFSNNASPEMSGDMTSNIVSDQIASPGAASPSLAPSDFEPPQQTQLGNQQPTNDINQYSQQSTGQQSLDQHHHTHSPLSQTHSPISMGGIYSQQHQSMGQMMNNVTSSPAYSPYSRHQQLQQPSPQQQQSYMNHTQSQIHQQSVPQNVVNSKQMAPQLNGSASTDLFKDVAAKSLSGLESLVDQIPNINDQDAALNSLSASSQNAQSNESYTNMLSGYSSPGASLNSTNLPAASSSVGSTSLALPSLTPHHHSHYPYSSHAPANQSPYSANPFSVSSLTSSTYSTAAAAAMNSYHQNLMGTSHLTSSFMEPPHMPVPVSPLYHSYQQQGYPGYPAPPHPSAAAALHMSNYPYYTNTGYTQAPGSSYHSMFDRINF